MNAKPDLDIADLPVADSWATSVTDDLERIRTGIGALTGSGGLGGLGHLAPVLGLLTEALKSRKG